MPDTTASATPNNSSATASNNEKEASSMTTTNTTTDSSAHAQSHLSSQRRRRRTALPPIPVPPVKCFCRDLEPCRVQCQQAGIRRRLFSVMGVIQGFAAVPLSQRQQKSDAPDDVDNDKKDESMTTKQAMKTQCMVLDDGSGGVAMLRFPSRFARQNTALFQSLRAGLIAECIVSLEHPNDSDDGDTDGGDNSERGNATNDSNDDHNNGEDCWWIDSMVLWTADQSADELLSLRGMEIQQQHRQRKQQLQQQQQETGKTITRTQGYPTLSNWSLQQEIFEWIQSCANDDSSNNEGGVTVEELSVVSNLGINNEKLQGCLQMLQLEGQIYRNENGRYQPL